MLCNKIDKYQPFESTYVQYKKKKITKEKVICKSPDWFLNEVAKQKNVSVKKLVVPDKVNKYVALMKKGNKFPTVVLKKNRSDGIHRAYAAKKLGLKTIPVVV